MEIERAGHIGFTGIESKGDVDSCQKEMNDFCDRISE